MVFSLYYAKWQVIVSEFRITHEHWLTLMQGVWWNVSMANELPESQHESCTIIFWQDFDVEIIEMIQIQASVLFMVEYDCRIDNGSGRWNSYK
jgi:hypothetical protein